MKDIRNPIDVFKEIMFERRIRSCGILEAADRVEAHRASAQESTSLTNAVTTRGGQATPVPPGHPAAQWPVQ